LPTPEKKVVGGMNPSDAKESIGLGGSLKDRMAALQGRGAFGGLDGGASPPPKPATQKPKWKPPPVVPPADDTEGEIRDSDPVKSPPPPIVQKSSETELPKADVDDEPTEAPDGEEAVEQLDPEEEERQRRAAIAARMARLGGARLGMAPPVFGKKPSIKKSDPAKDGETQSLESKPASSSGERESIPRINNS
jgi:myosin tail region-interacting protein MTI1